MVEMPTRTTPGKNYLSKKKKSHTNLMMASCRVKTVVRRVASASRTLIPQKPRPTAASLEDGSGSYKPALSASFIKEKSFDPNLKATEGLCHLDSQKES